MECAREMSVAGEQRQNGRLKQQAERQQTTESLNYLVLQIVAFTLLSILTVFVFQLDRNTSVQTLNNVFACTTNKCTRMFARLTLAINHSRCPCADLYSYVCEQASMRAMHKSRHLDHQEHYSSIKARFYTQTLNEKHLKPIMRRIGKFYTSCLYRTNTSRNLRASTLKEIVSNIWKQINCPLSGAINKALKCVSSETSIMVTIYKLRINFGVEIYNPDIMNTERKVRPDNNLNINTEIIRPTIARILQLSQFDELLDCEGVCFHALVDSLVDYDQQMYRYETQARRHLVQWLDTSQHKHILAVMAWRTLLTYMMAANTADEDIEHAMFNRLHFSYYGRMFYTREDFCQNAIEQVFNMTILISMINRAHMDDDTFDEQMDQVRTIYQLVIGQYIKTFHYLSESEQHQILKKLKSAKLILVYGDGLMLERLNNEYKEWCCQIDKNFRKHNQTDFFQLYRNHILFVRNHEIQYYKEYILNVNIMPINYKAKTNEFHILPDILSEPYFYNDKSLLPYNTVVIGNIFLQQLYINTQNYILAPFTNIIDYNETTNSALKSLTTAHTQMHNECVKLQIIKEIQHQLSRGQLTHKLMASARTYASVMETLLSHAFVYEHMAELIGAQMGAWRRTHALDTREHVHMVYAAHTHALCDSAYLEYGDSNLEMYDKYALERFVYNHVITSDKHLRLHLCARKQMPSLNNSVSRCQLTGRGPDDE